jgi:hypothetical protein
MEVTDTNRSMRLAITVAFLIVCGACGARAQSLEYGFLGPSPARNFQPIQLIFLQMPFERATTVGLRRIHLDIESAESNEIATTQGRIESTLKFESNRTVLGVRYGFLPGWEAAMHMPFISRYGGFLDPIIDEVEGLFDAGNPERDFYRNNTFQEFRVARGDTVIFEDRKETLFPGDLWFTVKRELRVGPEWPVFGVRAAIKVPSGSLGKVTGSGQPDFGLGFLADYHVWSPLMLYLNFNIVYPVGPITDVDLTLNPMVSESFAAEFALARQFSVLLHQAVYTSPMHGTGVRLLDNGTVELGLGFNWVLTNNVALQLLTIQNMTGVESAADFTLMLALKLGFAPFDEELLVPDGELAPLPTYPGEMAPLPTYP